MSRKPIPAEAFDHGDPKRYRRGCRCDTCKAGQNARNLHLRYLRQTGRGMQRPADRAADHVLLLRTRGLNDRIIMRKAQVVPDVLYRIMRREGTIHVTVERRILSIPAPEQTDGPTASRAYIPALGTHRRLHALVAAGWHVAELARRLGKDRENLGPIVNQRRSGKVAMFLADQVRHLYDELQDQRPEDHGVLPAYAERARRMAAARGWLPPAYWDDDEFDNPDFIPAAAPTPRYIELAENGLELEAQGYTRQQAADRLGVNKAALQQAIGRYRAAQAGQYEAAA